MKIYIPSILPIFLKDKLNKLTKLFGEPKIEYKYEIISKENGLIIIENKDIFNIESSFNTDYELIKNYKNYDLLVDRTNNIKVKLLSQFPVNYITTKITELEFKINKKSNLSIVIEYLEEPLEQFDIQKIPINFYFKYDNKTIDLNDPFFQEDFDIYLSIFI